MNPDKEEASPATAPANDLIQLDLDQIKAVIESLPEEQKLEVLGKGTSISLSYSGPLPHPADLEKFERILPGAADRILGMAEREQALRESQSIDHFRGMRVQVHWAGVAAVGLVAVAGIAAWFGNELIALPLGLVGLMSLIIQLISGLIEKKAK